MTNLAWAAMAPANEAIGTVMAQTTASIETSLRKLLEPVGYSDGSKEGGEGGIRTARKSLGKTARSKDSGAKSGALATQIGPIDPGLALLIEAWPTLLEPIRAGILAMVRAAGG